MRAGRRPCPHCAGSPRGAGRRCVSYLAHVHVPSRSGSAAQCVLSCLGRRRACDWTTAAGADRARGARGGGGGWRRRRRRWRRRAEAPVLHEITWARNKKGHARPRRGRPGIGCVGGDRRGGARGAQHPLEGGGQPASAAHAAQHSGRGSASSKFQDGRRTARGSHARGGASARAVISSTQRYRAVSEPAERIAKPLRSTEPLPAGPAALTRTHTHTLRPHADGHPGRSQHLRLEARHVLFPSHRGHRDHRCRACASRCHRRSGDLSPAPRARSRARPLPCPARRACVCRRILPLSPAPDSRLQTPDTRRCARVLCAAPELPVLLRTRRRRLRLRRLRCSSAGGLLRWRIARRRPVSIQVRCSALTAGLLPRPPTPSPPLLLGRLRCVPWAAYSSAAPRYRQRPQWLWRRPSSRPSNPIRALGSRTSTLAVAGWGATARSELASGRSSEHEY